MQIAKFLRPAFLGLILCASHARTFSLVNGYGAPIEVYKILEHHDDAGKGMNKFFFECLVFTFYLQTMRFSYSAISTTLGLAKFLERNTI